MSKFKNVLIASNEKLKEDRANLLLEDAKNEQSALITDLRGELNSLKRQQSVLADLGPETTLDLKPGKGFNAKEWVRQMHQLCISIEEKSFELNLAEHFMFEWFTDSEEPTPISKF